ncbi:MAG TPA: hypothetical protein VGA51_03080 [Casimicrobiaceae bacterium]
MEQHWLTRPETIRKLWRLFVAVLAAVVFVEVFVTHDAHFDVERLFGFYALFGFVACAVLIVLAKAIGVVLKRPDTYYDDEAGDA